MTNITVDKLNRLVDWFIPPDMVNARRTIDLLEVLHDKTQGNLTPAESRFLEEVLYELRLSYVEVEKRGTRKQK